MPAEEILIRVDDKDNQVGTDTRENCHLGRGLRHRAYVVFLFHGGELLLQRRSREKLLWPGYWDVSYTSHVYPGETYFEAALRRGVQAGDPTSRERPEPSRVWITQRCISPPPPPQWSCWLAMRPSDGLPHTLPLLSRRLPRPSSQGVSSLPRRTSRCS